MVRVGDDYAGSAGEGLGRPLMRALIDASERPDAFLASTWSDDARVERPAWRSALGTVAGLASGSPNYDKLSPGFAEVVRRDLPMTHAMFSGLGELKSVTFRERGPRGDDAYSLVFANGEVIMSAALDADGRMLGGILQPVGTPGR